MNGPDFSHNNPMAIFFFSFLIFLTFDHLYSLCGKKNFLFHIRVLKESSRNIFMTFIISILP